MMDRLREGVNSIAIKIILGVIILSFVLAGVSSYLVGGGSNAAAKVDGVKISRNEFEHAYQNERNRMQSQMGDYFSNRLSDPAYVNLFRRSVLDRMINDLLLEEHAKSLGLSISDAQVRKAIVAMPAFQNAGKFDKDVYNNALQRIGFSPDSFANYMRSEMIRNQLLSAIQGSSFSLNKETQSLANLFLQTREYRAISIDAKNFVDGVHVTDKEVSDYYAAHQDHYARPEEYKLAYLELSADKLKGTIEVSDKDAQAYYQEHIDQFSTEEQRKVSHIQLNGNDKKAAQAILEQIRQGADFATLAKEKSVDKSSAKKGGSLGWLEKGTVNEKLAEAIFALKNKGDVSELVKSPFGYHIIKLDDIKAPQAKSFTDVKHQVIAAVQEERAADLFYKRQTDLDKVAFESPNSLDASAKAISGKVEKTDFISLDKLPKILSGDAVRKALENPEVKSDGMNSAVIEIGPEDVVVVRVDGVHPETILSLDKVKDQIKAQLIADKAMKAARQVADTVVAGLTKGDQSVLAANKLTFSKVQTVNRQSALAESIFALKKPTKDQPVYSVINSGNDHVQVIELSGVDVAKNAEFDKQLAAQLQRLNSQLDETGILNILRKNADIKVYIATE